MLTAQDALPFGRQSAAGGGNPGDAVRCNLRRYAHRHRAVIRDAYLIAGAEMAGTGGVDHYFLRSLPVADGHLTVLCGEHRCMHDGRSQIGIASVRVG